MELYGPPETAVSGPPGYYCSTDTKDDVHFYKKNDPESLFFFLLPLLLGSHHQFVLLGYMYGNTSESSQLSRSGLWRGCVQRQYIH